MKVILAADHGGFALKEQIKKYLNNKKFIITDVGALTLDEMDGFSDYIKAFITEMRRDANNRGIIICGTGIAMSMAANRCHGIRAANCHSIEYARLAREHNDANVLCLGGRFTDAGTAQKIIDTFLITKFLGGKYQKRNEILDTIT